MGFICELTPERLYSRVQPKTEELLNLLLWSTDQLMNPSFRNLTDSFETWAYRNGFQTTRSLRDWEGAKVEKYRGFAGWMG